MRVLVAHSIRLLAPNQLNGQTEENCRVSKQVKAGVVLSNASALCSENVVLCSYSHTVIKYIAEIRQIGKNFLLGHSIAFHFLPKQIILFGLVLFVKKNRDGATNPQQFGLHIASVLKP